MFPEPLRRSRARSPSARVVPELGSGACAIVEGIGSGAILGAFRSLFRA